MTAFVNFTYATIQGAAAATANVNLTYAVLNGGIAAPVYVRVPYIVVNSSTASTKFMRCMMIEFDVLATAISPTGILVRSSGSWLAKPISTRIGGGWV